MFSFFKKRSESKELKVDKSDKFNFQFSLELQTHVVDGVFSVKLPTEYIPYESDKFRAKTEDGMKSISITNRQKPRTNELINKQFFQDLKLELYDIFVRDGGYEAYDDLKITDEYIRKGFKVDEETQYYFTSARIINGNIIITDFIVREISGYNRVIFPSLEIIDDSMDYVG